jgi:hypothetical protein
MNRYPVVSYEFWPEDPRDRELEAENTFGMHLFMHVRDAALERIPAGLSAECRLAAARAIDDTIYQMLALLDGVPGRAVGPEAVAEYVLSVHLKRRGSNSVETFGLAPGGDGLCMGFAGWREGKFGDRID